MSIKKTHKRKLSRFGFVFLAIKTNGIVGIEEDTIVYIFNRQFKRNWNKINSNAYNEEAPENQFLI